MTAEQKDQVFRALSDPIRRDLLDLLKDCPRTTGDLCAPFQVSRYAVMKHLGVLEAAGLIRTEKRGRQCWNHLEAAPLQRTYEKWVRGFERHWSKSLHSLKSLVEERERQAAARAARSGELDMNDKKNRAWGQFSIEQEIRIEAPRARVFEALITDINSWWAYRFSKEGTSTVRLEPRVGGAFFEDFGGGEGALWGTVTYIKAPEILRLDGPLGMDTAVSSTYTYDLVEADRATIIHLSHQASGFIDPKWGEAHGAGWGELLGRLLKGWVEEGKKFTEFPNRRY